MRRIAASLLLVGIALIGGCRTAPMPGAAPVPDATPPGPLGLAEIVGPLDYAVLPEVSGLVASRVDADLLWFVNDSGNSAELVALTVPAMTTARVGVQGARNHDWEDLAAFALDGQAWIAIADVGDNNAVRDSVALHFVPEPARDAATTQRATTLRFTYDDGPRDVEAVAIDTARDRIFLLSKRTRPPVLYTLPLRAALAAARRGDTLVAQAVGPVTSIPAPTALELRLSPKFGKYRDQPTAMDLSPDGNTIALLTYGEAYRADIAPGQSWLEAMNGVLEPLGMPVLAQPETIAWGADGSLYVSSEQKGAPLIHWPAHEH